MYKKIMTPFIIKQPSLVVCPKTERLNIQSFGFQTEKNEIRTYRSDFGIISCSNDY